MRRCFDLLQTFPARRDEGGKRLGCVMVGVEVCGSVGRMARHCFLRPIRSRVLCQCPAAMRPRCPREPKPHALDSGWRGALLRTRCRPMPSCFVLLRSDPSRSRLHFDPHSNPLLTCRSSSPVRYVGHICRAGRGCHVAAIAATFAGRRHAP